MKKLPESSRSPQSFRLPDELVAQARKRAAREGKTVTDIVSESLASYLSTNALLGCCTHLGAKGPAMPVNRSSIPLDEWGSLGR